MNMTGTLVLKNAKIVMPTEIVEGSVLLRDGLIEAIFSGACSSPEALDMEGDYIIAGLIDVHTDNLERHMLPRNNADWPVMAALIAHDAQLATAGITTVLDSMCVGTAGKGVRNFAKVEEAIAGMGEAKNCGTFRVDHLLHLRAELSQEKFPEMFSRLHTHPDLRLVSLMDHTPGQRQWADMEKYMVMEKRDFKLTQEEIEAFVDKCREGHDRYSEPNRREVLSVLAGRDVTLASHDDTTLEHVEQAHAEGVRISEFPTTMLAAQAARDRQMEIVAGAPNLVLGRSHSGNVAVEELAQLGLVDVLSSDYAPSSLLYGAFLLAKKTVIPLHEAIRTVTLNPARLVGLKDRGSIETGKRADLVRVRLVEELPLVATVWREGTRIA
jgi:alpha-D-ribose 1-methylphosphonate 5-triphosphate diphosphatase